jgi:hypothetical protein
VGDEKAIMILVPIIQRRRILITYLQALRILKSQHMNSVTAKER